MKFLFNEQVDDYFLQIAELNNNGEKLSIEDYIKEFEKEPDLNIEFLGYESIIGYEFYYLVEYDIPIRIIPCPPNMLIDLLKRNLKLTDEIIHFSEKEAEKIPVCAGDSARHGTQQRRGALYAGALLQRG